jgi:hypothetical protein
MAKAVLDDPRPIQIDLTYLCVNDPNYKKITEANGLVLPEDDQVHKGGFITEQKTVSEKKYFYAPGDGRKTEFEHKKQTAVFICATCNANKTIDPYEPGKNRYEQ